MSANPCRMATCAAGVCTSAPLPDGLQGANGQVCLGGVCRGNGIYTANSSCGVAVDCDGAGCALGNRNTTAEGGIVCVNQSSSQVMEPCVDCPTGEVCVTTTCLGVVCVTICETTSATRAAFA